MTETDDGLFVFPPGKGRGAQWLARSVGGIHDLRPVIATGETRAKALQLARDLRRWPVLE